MKRLRYLELCDQNIDDIDNMVAEKCPDPETRRKCARNILLSIHPDRGPEHARCKRIVQQLLEYLNNPQSRTSALGSNTSHEHKLVTWDGLDDEMYCSKTALTQHKGTCYMAAACTVAFRMIKNNPKFRFLIDDVYSLTVKNFLEKMNLSMLECAQPPSLIRKAYTILRESPIMTTKFGFTTVDRTVLSNVEKTEIKLEEGGSETLFLMALIALYGLKIHYGPFDPKTDLSKRNDDEIFLLHHSCSFKISELAFFIREKSKNMNVQAVLITLDNRHAICAFPCREHFIFCNSWGEPCSEGDEIYDVFKNRYDTVVMLGFVCNGLKPTHPKKAPNAEAEREQKEREQQEQKEREQRKQRERKERKKAILKKLANSDTSFRFAEFTIKRDHLGYAGCVVDGVIISKEVKTLLISVAPEGPAFKAGMSQFIGWEVITIDNVLVADAEEGYELLHATKSPYRSFTIGLATPYPSGSPEMEDLVRIARVIGRRKKDEL